MGTGKVGVVVVVVVVVVGRKRTRRRWRRGAAQLVTQLRVEVGGPASFLFPAAYVLLTGIRSSKCVGYERSSRRVCLSV